MSHAWKSIRVIFSNETALRPLYNIRRRVRRREDEALEYTQLSLAQGGGPTSHMWAAVNGRGLAFLHDNAPAHVTEVCSERNK